MALGNASMENKDDHAVDSGANNKNYNDGEKDNADQEDRLLLH